MSATSGRPGFADQQALLRWADTLLARTELPRLVRRLVLETGIGVTAVDFPAGEGTAVGGWDGIARAAAASSHLPEGLSLWELSAGRSTTAKAKGDFDKRLTTPDGSATTGATYCAVSVRRWADRRQFAFCMRDIGRWRDVRAYGVDDLETWLEDAPITHAWISERLGLKPYGMRTTDAWWVAWASATLPTLTRAVVLAGRAAEATELRTRLADGPGITTVSGGSTDEILAAIAAIALGDDEDQPGDESARLAFVDDPGTWRALADSTRPLILVACSPAVIEEASGGAGHHVIVPVTGTRRADIELSRLDARETINALKAAGLQEQQAETAGRLARWSLLALRRNLARKPELTTPAWAASPVPRAVRGALLAGSWDERGTGDQQALTRLTGVDYDELREDLAAIASAEDPFLARVGDTWSVVSPSDAWLQLEHAVRSDDLDRFGELVERVLLEQDPTFGLPTEEVWKLSSEGATRTYSNDLRGGFARTIALLGTVGERVEAGRDLDGAAAAAALVARLVRPANGDATGAAWFTLTPHLSMLAEAAPDVFLDAVRSGTANQDPVLRRLFTDGNDPGLFGSSSGHTELLWALERLAWSQSHLGQVLDILARLTEIDPGGKLSNRPAAALASILCPWHPETTAAVASRLAAIDGLRRRHPVVAWELMLALLPAWQGIHSPTAAPRFRDWKPPKVEVTHRQWFECVDGLVDRLLADAGPEADRWRQLVDSSQSLSPDHRRSVRAGLRSAVANLGESGRDELWSTLRETVGRHRDFADADWALPGDELDEFEEIADLIAPARPVNRVGWLFAEHAPDLGDGTRLDDYSAYTASLADRRRRALADVAAVEGWDGVVELCSMAVVPQAVGFALGDSALGDYDARSVTLLDSDLPAEVNFAAGYVSARFQRRGWRWLESFLGPPSTEGATARMMARLLHCTNDHPADWERADALGPDIAIAYWTEFNPLGLGHQYPHVTGTARRLMAVGRPGAAIHLIASYSLAPDAAPIGYAEAMADALDELNQSEVAQEEFMRLREFDFQTAFALLEAHRADLGEARVGRLEWLYLKALGHEPNVPSLHRALAADPQFFVGIVSVLYRPASGPSREPTADNRRIAENAFHLLASWRLLPGASGATVDGEALDAWVDEALTLLDAADRRDVGEITIGHVLASAPAGDDGAWPCVQVRELLERLQAERVEQGIQTQVANNRGVTSRDPESGGDQERALAAEYRSQAEKLNDRWPRIAAVLRGLADTYEHEARIWDRDAERLRRGMER